MVDNPDRITIKYDEETEALIKYWRNELSRYTARIERRCNDQGLSRKMTTLVITSDLQRQKIFDALSKVIQSAIPKSMEITPCDSRLLSNESHQC